MAIVNITCENDADFYRSFAYQTQAGIPINITGAGMVMKLRKHAADVIALLELSTDEGEIVLANPAQGLFTVFIAQERLVQMVTGDYEHSLIMSLNDLKTRIWSGIFTVTPGPSR